MNSRMAWSYERFELADVRLFKTADFDCSRSGNLRTVFGTRLRLLFAIGSGLRCRGEKRDPVPALLTSRAFLSTNPTDELITSDCPSSKQSKSILPWARWSPDAEPFHLVKQRSAFQSKPGGRAARPPELPVGALTRS